MPWSRVVLAAVVAAVLDVLVLLIARAADVSFTLGLGAIDRMGGLTWYVVAVVAALGALGGALFAAGVRRVLPPDAGRQVFGWTVAVLAILSCVPLILLSLPAATTVALAIMHLVVGGVVLTLLRPPTPSSDHVGRPLPSSAQRSRP